MQDGPSCPTPLCIPQIRLSPLPTHYPPHPPPPPDPSCLRGCCMPGPPPLPSSTPTSQPSKCSPTLSNQASARLLVHPTAVCPPDTVAVRPPDTVAVFVFPPSTTAVHPPIRTSKYRIVYPPFSCAHKPPVPPTPSVPLLLSGPSGPASLLSAVAEPICLYLRSRPDTVKCLVAMVTQGGGGDGGEEEEEGEGVSLLEELRKVRTVVTGLV